MSEYGVWGVGVWTRGMVMLFGLPDADELVVRTFFLQPSLSYFGLQLQFRAPFSRVSTLRDRYCCGAEEII